MENVRDTETHIYFWGSVFSNWYPSKFRYKNLVFYNTEQAYMWEKAMFFGDIEIGDKILISRNPKECKKLGRKVNNYIDSVWTLTRYRYMYDVNYCKYDQNDNLKELLLSTKDKILVEGSPNDIIWGVGIHYQDDDILDEKKWKGINLLGEVLMDVRKNLRNDEHI